MAMMSFFSRSKLLSHLHPQQGSTGANPSSSLHSRALHIELGAREKALLEEDPALKRFKSHKRNVWRLKRLGDALTIVVVAGCCWEIYVRAEMKKAAREKEQTHGG
ncbi:Succinate dehydrogenase subunit 7B [Nymphaea thermarum]|nr:Succinate dehydrogenase subunit 7B [Nymphaea thermarum]